MIRDLPKSRISARGGCARNVGIAAALSCLLLAGPAFAHEGHEHEEPDDDAVAAVPAAPSLALSSAHIELVATRSGGDLVIYIDDYASNAPIDGLRVQLRDGTRVLQADAAGDGMYRLPGDLIDGSKAEPVTFVVQGAGFDEQLQGELPAALLAHAGDQAHASNRLLPIAAAIIVALAVLFGWRTLSRRRSRSL